MKYLMLYPLLFIPLLGNAQQSISASGGNATGLGGTATFSIGQIAWNMFAGANGSVTQGVQQPYEISVISGIDDYDITLNFVIYPNPTTGKVTLKIGETAPIGLKFQMFSTSGVLLQEKKIEDSETEIHFDYYPSATYFLRVIKDQALIKLFKIVKN